MSLIRTFNLQCDGEECAMPMFDLDTTPRWRTAAQIRSAARRAGWRRTRDGRDLCPDHAARPRDAGDAPGDVQERHDRYGGTTDDA